MAKSSRLDIGLLYFANRPPRHCGLTASSVASLSSKLTTSAAASPTAQADICGIVSGQEVTEAHPTCEISARFSSNHRCAIEQPIFAKPKVREVSNMTAG